MLFEIEQLLYQNKAISGVSYFISHSLTNTYKVRNDILLILHKLPCITTNHILLMLLKYYLKITFRNLLKNRVSTLINLLGLGVGIACAIMLLLYIQDELNYDTYHKNYDRIYRITSHFKTATDDRKIPLTPAVLAKALKKDFPEVEEAVYFYRKRQAFVSTGDRKFYQKKMYYTQTGIFKIFDYDFIVGNAETALDRPYTVVLTETVATKAFGNARLAMNQTIDVGNKEKVQVTGVIRDLPQNTNVRFSALVSLNSLDLKASRFNMWNNANGHTLLTLKKDADVTIFRKQVKNFIYKHTKEQEEFKHWLRVQALGDIYLKSDVANADELGPRGNMAYIYIFSVVVLFLLIIAGINYMNLATAKSTNRAKEVGVRKVHGAYRQSLMKQFMLESTLIALCALVVGLLLVELTLPLFNQIAGKSLAINYLQQPTLIALFAGVAILIGAISGVYPAFFLSGFNPVLVLKGKFSRSKKGSSLRKGLVVVQFTVSIVMIIATWIVYQQLNYVSEQDLGFDKEQMVIIDLKGKTREKVDLFKNRLANNANVLKITSTTAIQGTDENDNWGIDIEQEGGKKIVGHTDVFLVDEDYTKTMGIKVLQGRALLKQDAKRKGVMVNETFVKKYGWNKALGKKIGEAKVVGVMKDFHLTSLHDAIQPLALFLVTRPRKLVVKINSKNVSTTLRFLKETYISIDQKHPFEPYFLDQTFAGQYRADKKRGQVLLIFAGLAIFIACLGLFGLASFTAEQRTKEMGIRKVLGATISQLMLLVSKEFLSLVLVASLIAIPLAVYFMNSWLQNFAYRTEVWQNWFVFLLSAIAAVGIAVATVSFQAYRAASVNPATVLKNE